ncbi:MAG: LysR family transcriptional regulator [Cypionkella sp.]|nr:LysR family transcriptional regulator [Cypionkella sp.]
MPIDPRQLKLLRAVVQAGSFSAAAEALNMSQPTVSVAIRQLEAQVGKPVLLREPKGVRVTEIGRRLLGHAIALENVLNAATAEMNNERLGVTGPLQIGGTPGAVLAMVPGIIHGLQDDGGAYDISVHSYTDTEIPGALKRREIELGFCTEAPADPALEDIALRSEPFVLVAAPGVLGRDVLTLAQAAQHPWIWPRQDGETRKRLEAVFLAADVPLPKSVIRCDLLATQKAILQKGCAIALLPRAVLQSELDSGLLCETVLRGAPPARRLIARKLRGQDLSALAQRALSISCGAAGSSV